MPNSSDVARLAAAAWHRASRANREAHADTAIHASQLHECPRALHYRVTDTPHTDLVPDRLAIKAHWGTALHEFYLPHLAETWRESDDVDGVEVEPELALPRRDGAGPFLVARPDLGIIYTDGSIGIGELKTTGKAGVDAALAGEPKGAHLDQCRLAAILTEHLSGQPVRGYWIYYLDRADPERHWAIVERAWDGAEIDRAQHLVDYAASIAADIAAAPRWFGRHTSDAGAPYSPCATCPWRTGCLGKDAADPARGEAAAELVDALNRAGADVRAAEEGLAEFMRRKAGVDGARARKASVSDLVTALGLEPGEYAVGDAVHRLVWREGHDRADVAACVKMLEALGKPVPKMRTAGFFQIKT